MNIQRSPVVLQVVRSEGESVDRLGVAIAHLEIAIAHINNAAQGAIEPAAVAEGAKLEEFRLIVTALGDIRESLRTLRSRDSETA